MFQTKVAEKIETHFVFNNYFSENRAVYEIMWVNIVVWVRPQMVNIIRSMRISSCIPKATNTHSEYVIVIAFPKEQWLHGRASI